MKLYDILQEIKIQKPLKNKYVKYEDGSFIIDKTKALEYLQQFDNEEVDADIFVYTNKIFSEPERYGLNNVNNKTNKEIEDFLRKEMSYNFYSHHYGLDEIKIQKPDPLYKEKQNLIKVIEADKEIAPGEEYIEDMEYTIEDIKSASSREELINIIEDHVLGDKNSIKYYIDLMDGNERLYESNPCWKGYKQIGTKTKGDTEVPNCVPIKEYNLKENDTKSFLEYLKSKSEILEEAEYQGRKVQLNKPMQGDIKKFKVYVKNKSGRVVKVNFGAKGMNIKKNNPKRRKAFRARHNCANPGPKWKARYWSCKKW